MKRVIMLLIIPFFVFFFNASVFAQANPSQTPSVGDIVGDVLWIRPLGCIDTTLRGIAFVVSLPVTIPLKKAKGAEEFLIEDPYRFYFKRPLGEFYRWRQWSPLPTISQKGDG